MSISALSPSLVSTAAYPEYMDSFKVESPVRQYDVGTDFNVQDWEPSVRQVDTGRSATWDRLGNASFYFKHFTHQTSSVFATALSAVGRVTGAVLATAVGFGSLGVMPYLASKLISAEDYGLKSGKLVFIALGMKLGEYFGEKLGALVGYVIGAALSPIAAPISMALDRENKAQSRFDGECLALKEEHAAVRQKLAAVEVALMLINNRELLNNKAARRLVLQADNNEIELNNKKNAYAQKWVDYHASQMDAHENFESMSVCELVSARKCLDKTKAFIEHVKRCSPLYNEIIARTNGRSCSVFAAQQIIQG